MLECPIVYFENNLVFDNQRGCWAGFQLDGFVYENRSSDRKTSYLYELAAMLSDLTGDAQILIIPSALDIKAHTDYLKKSLSSKDPIYDTSIQLADDTLAYLQEKSEKADSGVNEYDTYLFAKLDKTADGEQRLKDALDYLFRDPVNAINTFMATSEKEILESRVRQMTRLSQEFYDIQNTRIPMHPIPTGKLQFLYKRAMLRGKEKEIQLNRMRSVVRQGKNKTTVWTDWVPYAQKIPTLNGEDQIVRPYRGDIVNLFRGEINPRDRMLEVTNSEGAKVYETFLTFSHIPEQLAWPNNEWIYNIQNMGLQAEICIYISPVAHRDALEKLDGKRTEINSQMGNVEEAGARMPEDLYGAVQETDELEKYLKSSRAPLLKTCVSVCLFGDSPEEAEWKAKQLMAEYKDMHYVMERPLTDQTKLFLQHLPGAGQYVKDFNMLLPPITLAGGVFGTTNALGDTVGPYVGTVGDLQHPVFLSLGLACLLNKSAAMTLFGDLGYGKSFAANLLILLNVLYGGYSLIFDPKGERSHWVEQLDFLEGMVTLVTLTPDQENMGALDPFIVYRNDFEAAKALALNVVTELYGLRPKDDEYIVLMEALEAMGKVKDTEKPCMLGLCHQLEKVSPTDEMYESAKKLARRLRTTRSAGMSMLLFGTGEEKGIQLDNRLNILQIQNLKLPDPNTPKEDFATDEILSTVLMMVLGNFAKQFALTQRDVFSLILFDESWALGKTTEGKKLYDFLSRMGRSLYTGCIFNGHSVLDIPSEGIKNTITYRACFHTSNKDEADRMLEYLGLEITPDNEALIMGLGNGQCLFRDVYGRIGVLSFDAVFQNFKDLFTTTPKARQETEEDSFVEEASAV